MARVGAPPGEAQVYLAALACAYRKHHTGGYNKNQY
jgi:hypothetical protein